MLGHYLHSSFVSMQRRRLCTSWNAKEEKVPVLVVGAGPVGLILSLLLTKLGIKCSVMERRCELRNHPQAHFINNRSMEVFRKLDNLSEEIEMLQPPLDQWRKFIYCSSLFGSILGTVDHMQPQDLNQTRSPTKVAHFSQHRLVPLLFKKLEKHGFQLIAPVDNTDDSHSTYSWIGKIKLGHELVSFKSTLEGIRATICFKKGGTKVMQNLLCNYLIGADGANSAVRSLLRIQMHGEEAIQKLISVHFFSKELGYFLSKERPGMLYFVFNPKAIGVIVAHDLYRGEFVLQMPFYPPQQQFEDYSTETCRKTILSLAGHNLMDIDIKSIKQWTMHAEVAEKFGSCDDRILLAGDAAHRFPPAGGFGMNTGIQDAHNLAWKLASVLNGIASPEILATYEMERKPIALINTALSIENFKAAMSVLSALGLDPSIANSVHKAINSSLGSVLPSQMQSIFLESIFAVGRAQLMEPFINEDNPLGLQRLERVKKILEEGQSLQLQFPAEDLGFRYEEGALVPENKVSSEKLDEKPTGRRREYIPSSMPGSRLPHMQIKVITRNSPHQSKEQCSTLDLLPGNRIEFLLMIAPTTSCYAWADAALRSANEYNIPLLICIVWPKDTYSVQHCDERKHGVDSSMVQEIKPIDIEGFDKWRGDNAKHLIDVEETSGSWWELCKMAEPCAILVRPDEHIAWRSHPHFKDDYKEKMKKVFSTILRKP